VKTRFQSLPFKFQPAALQGGDGEQQQLGKNQSSSHKNEKIHQSNQRGASPPPPPPATTRFKSCAVVGNAGHITDHEWGQYVVGLCRLNQVDPYPITYSLSNP
jgi:hypothetical protein